MEKTGVKMTMKEAGTKIVHEHPHPLPLPMSGCTAFSLTAISQNTEAIKKYGLCKLADITL